MWGFKPLMPFMITWTRFPEHDASMYTSSMWGGGLLGP